MIVDAQPVVLFRYERTEDLSLFRELFDGDFEILSAQTDLCALEILENPPSFVNALVLDVGEDSVDLESGLLHHPLVRQSLSLKILLQNAISVGEIADLLKQGLMDFCFAKPFDKLFVRSEIVKAKLGVSPANSFSAPSIDYECDEPVLLLVDDEQHATKYLKRQLEALDCDFWVVVANSAEQALTFLQKNRAEITILLTDQRMPGASGKELLSIVRARYPQVVRMLTSAYDEVDIAMGAVNDDRIFRYLSKPWQVEDVIDSAHQAIAYWRQCRQAVNSELENVSRSHQQKLKARQQNIEQQLESILLEKLGSNFLPEFFSDLRKVEVLQPASSLVAMSVQEELEREVVCSFVETVKIQLSRLDSAVRILKSDPVQLAYFIERYFHCDEAKDGSLDSILSLLTMLMDASLLKADDIVCDFREHDFQLANNESAEFKLYSHLMGPLPRASSVFINQQVALFLLLAIWRSVGGLINFKGKKQSYDLNLSMRVQCSEKRGNSEDVKL